jgi:hypothetical protein
LTVYYNTVIMMMPRLLTSQPCVVVQIILAIDLDILSPTV